MNFPIFNYELLKIIKLGIILYVTKILYFTKRNYLLHKMLHVNKIKIEKS